MVEDSPGSQRQTDFGWELSRRRSEKKGDASQRSWRFTLKGCCLAPIRTVVIELRVGSEVDREVDWDAATLGGGGRFLSRLGLGDDDLEAVAWC